MRFLPKLDFHLAKGECLWVFDFEKPLKKMWHQLNIICHRKRLEVHPVRFHHVCSLFVTKLSGHPVRKFK